MKKVFFLAVMALLTVFNSYGKENIKVYLGPNMVFFADSVGVGALLGANIELGYSKFSPSDFISISPELSFSFSQTEKSYFSSISLKLIPDYEFLIYSFEKRYFLFLRIGFGFGFSFINVNVDSLSASGFGLVIEPVIGLWYNFLENFWVNLDFRYLISSDINAKITSLVSPSVNVNFAVQF